MSDLIPKVHETLATMDNPERRAYAMGLSHAFAEMFSQADAALKTEHDRISLLQRLTRGWESVRATLTGVDINPQGVWDELQTKIVDHE